MNTLRITAIALANVFLFQTFYYVNDFPPGYYFEKLILPLTGMALAGLFFVPQNKDRFLSSGGWLTILFAAYFFFTGCLAAYLFYRQSPALTISSQVKVLAFFYFFAAYYLARFLRPSGKTLFYSIVIPGVILAVLYIIVDKTVNVAALQSPDSNTFILDSKGYRIVYPSAIVITAFFACLHYVRYTMSFVAILAMFAIGYFLVVVFKQRFELLSVILASLLAIAGKRWSSVIVAAFTLLCVGSLAIAAYFRSQILSTLDQDTSWTDRVRQSDYVFSLFTESPLTIPIGVGKMSEVGDFGYKEMLGFYFTTSDIGWVGMLHEYGVVGTFLIAIMVVVLYKAVPHAHQLDNFYTAITANAFRSYIQMSLFISVLSPRFMYSSGIYFSILGYCVYLNQRHRRSH
jgi:hypothetical protein